MDLNEFIKFCNYIGFIVSHENELIFIFNAISDDKKKKKLNKITLFKFIESKFITEKEFIENGKCQNLLLKDPLNIWSKKIPKYGETKKLFYLNLYSPYYEIFKLIERQSLKYKIYNLTNYFYASNDIDKNGYIPKISFKRILLTFGVNSNDKLNELIRFLEDENNKNNFKLCIFLSIYNLFCPKEGKNSLYKKISLTIELPKTNELNILHGRKINKTEIVHKNKFREFSQQDIDQIKILSKYIADIINNEENESITGFFNKLDKEQKKYFTIEELRYIIDEELGIDTNDEIIDLFLDFVTEEKLFHNNLIIKIKKLISVIIGYAGTDEPISVGEKVIGNIQSTILSTAIQANFGKLTPSLSSLDHSNVNSIYDSQRDK
jgi:Ca2+-binding EF-hand superfamily protein